MMILKQLRYMFLALVLVPETLVAVDRGNVWMEREVSLSFKNEPLGDVLSQLSRQVDVGILFDESLKSHHVSGYFDSITIQVAVYRLFSQQNKIVIYDEDNRVIIVKQFGAKQYIWATKELSEVPKSNGMTAERLELLHGQQYKDYKAASSDECALLTGGMTKGELEAMHEAQYYEFKSDNAAASHLIGDENTIDELRSLHKEQYENFKAAMYNDDEIRGQEMTRSELRAVNERQYQAFKQGLESELELQLKSITRSELREINTRQYNEYKNSIEIETY